MFPVCQVSVICRCGHRLYSILIGNITTQKCMTSGFFSSSNLYLICLVGNAALVHLFQLPGNLFFYFKKPQTAHEDQLIFTVEKNEKETVPPFLRLKVIKIQNLP